MIVSAGWYIALVSLWPADSRPYIAGSTDNSLLQLAFGYNGIERIAGNEGGGPAVAAQVVTVRAAAVAAGNLFFGGEPGIGRLFGPSMGTEASWLLPAALIGLVAGLWLTWRAARTDRVRAGLLLWGGWLLVTGAVFSFMDGTVHPYYTVALAPAIAALVGISVAELVRRKDSWLPRLVLAAMLAATGVWAFVLLNRTPGVVARAALGRAGRVGRSWRRCSPSACTGSAAPPSSSPWPLRCSGSAATAAYSIDNACRSAHSGPGPCPGPRRRAGSASAAPVARTARVVPAARADPSASVATTPRWRPW